MTTMDLFQKMRIRFNVPSSPSPERRCITVQDESNRRPSYPTSSISPSPKLATKNCLTVGENNTPSVSDIKEAPEIKSSDQSNNSSSFERKRVSLKRSKAVNPMSIPGLIKSSESKTNEKPSYINPIAAALSRSLSISSSAPPLPPRPQTNNAVTNNHDSKDSNQLDTEEWRRRGKEMVDYIADYMDTINDRRVTPNVEPGYLKVLLPDSPPYKSENWDKIMSDFEEFIMPGVTHWQHPRFHAYFPAGNSYPSILADMITNGIGCIGFSWVSLRAF